MTAAAEETRLVLPEVVRAGQDASVLGPDDLLVDEGAELIPVMRPEAVRAAADLAHAEA